MKKNNRLGCLSWVLTAGLAVVLLSQTAALSSDLSRVERSTVWHLTPVETSLHKLADEELPADIRPGYEYYRLRLKLTNNSQRPARGGYDIGVKPLHGEKYAVRAVDSGSSAHIRMDPKIPAGGTGVLETVIGVNREEMQGTQLQLSYEDWGDLVVDLGTVDLMSAE